MSTHLNFLTLLVSKIQSSLNIYYNHPDKCNYTVGGADEAGRRKEF